MFWSTAVIKQPVEIVADDSLIGIAVKDIHGPKPKKMRMAWLRSANQVGLEIFEYVEPKADGRTDNFEYWKSGFIHICVTDPDIEELCKKISESGGRQRNKIWEVVPDKGIKIVFCEDPFGNIIQIYVHNYEQTILYPCHRRSACRFNVLDEQHFMDKNKAQELNNVPLKENRSQDCTTSNTTHYITD